MGFILNTSYKVQVDLLESESNINIENGTLHVIDNKLKVHLNDEIKTIPTSNYKVYTALLTQSGTGAPVVIVLENTIGNIWFTYEDVGIYYINSSGLFTENKTFNTISDNIDLRAPNAQRFSFNYADINTLQITVYDPIGDVGQDENLINTPIEIRVYN